MHWNIENSERFKVCLDQHANYLVTLKATQMPQFRPG